MLPPLLTSTKEKQLELQRRCVHPEGTWKPFNWQNLTQTFPERIASQAEEHPDRLAVIDQSSSITYLELDQAANAVAEAILAEVEPGSGAVALLTGVDGPAVIGALGILKAGKIFAGLVESFPLHRHKQIIEDAEIRVIVADEPNMARAYELVGDKRTLFQLEKIPSIAAQLPLKPPTLDDPALLNYTSGTTGQPKGVIHSHRSRLAEAVRAFSTYHVCDADRITITKSLAWPGSFRILIGGLKSWRMYSHP